MDTTEDEPANTRRPAPTWARVTAATIISLGTGSVAGYWYSDLTRPPETITIDASTACAEAAHAAELSLTERDRVEQHTTLILQRSADLYSAILTGTDTDIDQARDDLNKARMLRTAAESRATEARANSRAAAPVCQPLPVELHARYRMGNQ